MKVTTILPDRLVADVRLLAGGRNLTEALIRALAEWVNARKIRELNAQVGKTPFEFAKGTTAVSLREANRTR
jgi:hypothetical protein